jgi:23S rRNA (uracil1939-C5)-methyltransferase
VIDDVALTGEGVAHLPSGDAVFVPGTLDGEQIRADVGGGRPRRGKLLEVLAPSPRRVSPECGVASRCGGCDFMHLAPQAQADWHVRHVVRTLESTLARRGVALPAPAFHAAPAPLAYRTRARVHLRASGRRAEVGYRPPRSHELLAVERCAVLAPSLEPALVELAELFAGSRGDGEATVALGHGAQRVYDVRFSGELADAYFAGIERGRREGRIAGARVWLEGAREPLVAGDPRPVVQAADGAPLIVAAGGFAQASDAAGALLARRVAELAVEARATRAVELFAGSGTLTVALARAAGELVAIERDEPAVAALHDNLRARALAVKVRVGDAETTPLPRAELVVLDPPRGGAVGAVRAIATTRPRRVVYVSCNVATLARDLETLVEARYRPTSLDLFDLFPQTSHVEVVVALER